MKKFAVCIIMLLFCTSVSAISEDIQQSSPKPDSLNVCVRVLAAYGLGRLATDRDAKAGKMVNDTLAAQLRKAPSIITGPVCANFFPSQIQDRKALLIFYDDAVYYRKHGKFAPLKTRNPPHQKRVGILF
ncbi:hypothetical protein KW796_01150 [Candidatus Parcubacteria bacterium]|nr:hypothetical protein [Candidatus Parcubacteria bacterium]